MNDTHTILVVDDEALNRDMLQRRLERSGYRVLTAADGYAALGMTEVEAVDLVLLDIMMPGIDGIAVLEKLRAKRTAAQLPIVMASALDDADVIVRALNAGANDYVTKPLDYPVALARIQSQLRLVQSAASVDEPAPEDIAPGVTLGGRYLLMEQLGQGGFGVVYRARHIELECDVAVKLLHANLTEDPMPLERFRREGISACRVQHPNAVCVYDFNATGTGPAYLVMEYLKGRSLDEYLAACGSVTPERCEKIISPVCEVLASAHDAGVVHRDIKPENLFLAQIADRETTKVLDFGISELSASMSGTKLTNTGAVLGSPMYMAPERFLGEPAQERSDIFSLGVLLYEMLSGQHPFADCGSETLIRSILREDVSVLDSDTAGRMGPLVKRAMSRRAEDRPDAKEFLQLLRAAVSRHPPLAEPNDAANSV